MRIAFVQQPWSRVAPPVEVADSLAIWSYQVAKRLCASHEVAIYSRALPDSPVTERHQGIEYRRIPLGDARIWGRVARLWGRLRQSGAEQFSDLFQLRYIIGIALDLRRRGCDIVHIHNFSQFAPIVRALNPRARIVVHMHCEWLSQLDARLVASRLKHVDAIVGCSEHVTGKVRERFPDLEDRCHTVLNGVDGSKFRPRAEKDGTQPLPDLRLLFVGRLSPEKGIHSLLGALETVAQTAPEVGLDLVGPADTTPAELLVGLSDDPLVRALSRFYPGDYVEGLKNGMSPTCASRVRFHGSIPHGSLVEHYQRADVFVSPSLSDAFPIPLLEAMAAGLPVIATRVGGIPEIVDHEVTGLLVAPDRPDQVAEAILSLRDPGRRRAMSEAARARAERLFSWDRIVGALLGTPDDGGDAPYTAAVRGGR